MRESWKGNGEEENLKGSPPCQRTVRPPGLFGLLLVIWARALALHAESNIQRCRRVSPHALVSKRGDKLIRKASHFNVELPGTRVGDPDSHGLGPSGSVSFPFRIINACKIYFFGILWSHWRKERIRIRCWIRIRTNMSRIPNTARYTSYCNRGLPHARRKRGIFDQSRERRHSTAKQIYFLKE